MVEKKKIGVGVGAMLLNEKGQVLLGLRNPDKIKASSNLRGEGTWTMPGGGLEWGETFEEAALREIVEECGIELDSISVYCINNDKNEHAHFVTIGLLAENVTQQPQVCEPDVIIEWRWFDLDNLPANLYMPSAKVLENYKQKQFYIC